MSKLNAKFDADSFLYSCNHFACVGHTVQVLTQPPPPVSTVRSSLSLLAHSSPLALAARLHRHHTNLSELKGDSKMQGSVFVDVVYMYLNKQAKTVNSNPALSLYVSFLRNKSERC